MHENEKMIQRTQEISGMSETVNEVMPQRPAEA